MRGRCPILTPHVQEAGLQVDLIPAQRDGLGYAQGVAEGQKHQRLIPMPVAPRTARSHEELICGNLAVAPG
jgi:hypothetical protein